MFVKFAKSFVIGMMMALGTIGLSFGAAVQTNGFSTSAAITPISVTSTGQIVSTLNPSDTTFTNGSVIANPAACASNEILMGAGVNGTRVASFDCEGDVVGVKADFSGAVVATSTLNVTAQSTLSGGVKTAVANSDTTLTDTGAAVILNNTSTQTKIEFNFGAGNTPTSNIRADSSGNITVFVGGSQGFVVSGISTLNGNILHAGTYTNQQANRGFRLDDSRGLELGGGVVTSLPTCTQATWDASNVGEGVTLWYRKASVNRAFSCTCAQTGAATWAWREYGTTVGDCS